MKNIQKLKNGTFRCNIQVNSRREQPYFDNLSDAKNWVVSRKKFLKKAPEQAYILKTLNDLIDKYIETLTPSQKNASKAHQVFWSKFIGDCKIESLKRVMFEEGKELLKKQGYSASTVNCRVCFIKQVIKYAYCRWECIGEDVTKHLKMKSIKEFRDRILQKEEKGRLFEAASKCKDDLVPDAIVIGFDTGMRVNEILNLRKANCDFENDLIKIENTKSKETRHVYMSQDVKDVLLKRFDRHSIFIFQSAQAEKPISAQYLNTCFKKVVKAAKIDNFVFHDIRHNAATFFAQNGMSLPNLMAMLGHKNLNITRRYVHCQNQVTKNQYFEALSKGAL